MIMKTLKEKLEVCSVCKNRKFDPDKGLICSLTKNKPEFENECISYEADPPHIEIQNARSEVYEENKSVSGWLAFFLWVGIGVGALVSAVMGVVQILNEGYVWLFSSISMVAIFSIVVIAIYAIIAFYRRKSNAVALATTYIVMIALDGVLSIVIATLLDDESMFPQAIRQFVWAAIWFTFLQKSNNVEELIPKHSRTWNRFEKMVLAIYIVSISLFTTAIVYAVKSDNPQNIFYTSRSYIDLSIAEWNKELPMIVGDGVTLQRIDKEDQSVVYTYQFSNTYIEDIDKDFLSENSMVAKYEILYELSKDPKYDEFAVTCFEEGYAIKYEYIDAHTRHLYSITISPEEYKSTIQNPYKCPIESLMDLIYKYNIQLPMEYMGDASLQRISLNESVKEITYKVRLPQLSLDEMTNLTTSYLNEYIISNWEALKDFVIRLAIVNQYVIKFDFITHSGLEYTTVRIYPDTYNTLE